VDFFRWFLTHRRKNDWTSWRSLFITFPAVLGLLFVAPQAAREQAAATRQQTSQGVVTAYDRSDHNQCSYVFSVLGRPYTGRRSAATTDVTVGDHVLVYYDSHDPAMNALEDFYEMSGRDRSFCYMLLFVIGVFVAVVLYARAAHVEPRDRPDRA
jgi:hypothetical protein